MNSTSKPAARPSVGADPAVKGDPQHAPTTQVDQDRAAGGDRGRNANNNLEQSRKVSGVPDAATPSLDGGGGKSQAD